MRFYVFVVKYVKIYTKKLGSFDSKFDELKNQATYNIPDWDVKKIMCRNIQILAVVKNFFLKLEKNYSLSHSNGKNIPS